MNRPTQWEYLQIFATLREQSGWIGDQKVFWEVEVPDTLRGDLSDALNRLGADGWEAVGMTPRGVGAAYYLFKRPVGVP